MNLKDFSSHDRSLARHLALQCLFQREFGVSMAIEQVLSLFHPQGEKPLSSVDYAKHLLEGVVKYKKEIDSLLIGISKSWSLQRMSLVDRNIMRIGVFELKFSSKRVKRNIILNEAIELAKVYGDKDSFRFVNGILDRIDVE